MPLSESGPPHEITVLLGNPTPRSRTRSVVAQAVDVLYDGLAAEGVVLGAPHTIDLAELLPRLGCWRAEDRPSEVCEALATVSRAGLLVVGSPTFKGTFTGLLKL